MLVNKNFPAETDNPGPQASDAEARHLPKSSRKKMPATSMQASAPNESGASSAPTGPPGPARVLAPVPSSFAEILTPAALRFIADLSRRFEPRRRELLSHRAKRQADFDAGAFPQFL